MAGPRRFPQKMSLGPYPVAAPRGITEGAVMKFERVVDSFPGFVLGVMVLLVWLR